MALLLCTYAPGVSADIGSIGGSPALVQAGNERSEGIFIFTLKPGESGANGVRIDNYRSEERTVVVNAVDSIASNDGSFACRQESEKKKEVGTWVTLESKKVTITAKSHTVVNLR